MIKTLILTIIMSSSVFAAELNLLGGESAVIEANSRTKVTCNGTDNGDLRCETHVNTLNKMMRYCRESYNNSHCLGEYWPNFRKEHPNCLSEALDTCFKFCRESYNNSHCLNFCK